MVDVFDVVDYILAKLKTTTSMKLQKLLYYSQAWSLVWDEEPLFPERIEAWANGPVIREVYDLFRGEFYVSRREEGDLKKITPKQKATIDGVLKYYGDKSAQWLSDLTHMEDPWKKAREGIPEGERGDSEITLPSMAEYYSGLQKRH